MAVHINSEPAGLTLSEALQSGWTENGMVFQYGYVSRKVQPENQPCYYGQGTRRGQLFVLLPNYKHTRYCYRLYLKRKEGAE